MTGIVDIFQYADTASNGVFGIGILVSLYLVVLIRLKVGGDEFFESCVTAGFFTSLIAVFVMLMGLISGNHLIIVFLLTALPAALAYYLKG